MVENVSSTRKRVGILPTDIIAPIYSVIATTGYIVYEKVVGDTKGTEFASLTSSHWSLLLNLSVLLCFIIPTSHLKIKYLNLYNKFKKKFDRNKNEHNRYNAKSYLSSFQFLKFFELFIIYLSVFYAVSFFLKFVNDEISKSFINEKLLVITYMIPDYFNLLSGIFIVFMFKATFSTTVSEDAVDNSVLDYYKIFVALSIFFFLVLCITSIYEAKNPSHFFQYKKTWSYFILASSGCIINCLGMIALNGRISAMDLYFDYEGESKFVSEFVNYGLKIILPLYAMIQILFPIITYMDVYNVEIQKDFQSIHRISSEIKILFFLIAFLGKTIFMSFIFQLLRKQDYPRFVYATYCFQSCGMSSRLPLRNRLPEKLLSIERSRIFLDDREPQSAGKWIVRKYNQLLLGWSWVLYWLTNDNALFIRIRAVAVLLKGWRYYFLYFMIILTFLLLLFNSPKFSEGNEASYVEVPVILLPNNPISPFPQFILDSPLLSVIRF